MLTEFKRLRTVSRGSSSSGSYKNGGFLETVLLLCYQLPRSATIALQFFVRSVGYLHMAHSKGIMGATSNLHVMTIPEDRQNGETSLKLT